MSSETTEEDLDNFTCEMCEKDIADGEPQIRFGVDSATKKGDDYYGSGEVVILAAFHSSCVLLSYGDEEFDSIPYIWEARDFLEMSTLCEECAAQIPPDEPDEPEPKPRHLKLLPGGAP